MLRDCGADFVELESSTSTANLAVVARMGVPEMLPDLGSSVRPEGSCPLVMLQIYGGTPPLATKPAVYPTATSPEGSGGVTA